MHLCLSGDRLAWHAAPMMTLMKSAWCAAAVALWAAACLTSGPTRAAGIASTESSAPLAGSQLQGAALVAALRHGGYVIYFRHTATDFSRSDSGMRSHDDCDNQRPLSAQGRADAAAIGQRIRALRLRLGEALASPYCRTMAHARLMLGDDVTPRNEIREAEGGDYPGLKQLLAAPVAPGSNRWIVGHGNPFRTIAGAPHLMDGEAAVIRPGGTQWTVVARLAVADWQALPPAAR
jgi:Histidine phosphatase superfamily (branch 1)